MANLPAIVRATRSSYRAITRMGQLSRQLRDAKDNDHISNLSRQFARAERRFNAAQHVLALNPLPGDR